MNIQEEDICYRRIDVHEPSGTANIPQGILRCSVEFDCPPGKEHELQKKFELYGASDVHFSKGWLIIILMQMYNALINL